MMNARLYYTEPSLRRFDARVVQVVADAPGRLRVWLDRTAFYPTSGGQPFDTGRLNEATVVDVLDDEEGGVVHVVEGGVLAAGDRVAGEIDWERRVDHMQQHTGQHLLSAAFERLHRVRTQSFRLGSDFSTIDLAREVTSAEIVAAEDESNRIVWEGRPVSIRFVSDAEAARLPLRKEPARGGRLRLVEVEGYDLSACGGTHVARTGEVGMIAVCGWEKFKGGTRVEFVCGERALRSYRSWREAATGAARLLSVLPAELPAAIDRLLQEGKDARRAAKSLAEKAAGMEAATLSDRATLVAGAAVFVDVLEGYDVNALKRLAGSFVREPGRVIVVFTHIPPAQVVAMRGGDAARVDCAALVSALTTRFGGRGGGKPESAQGGGLAGVPREWIEAAWGIVRAALGEAVP